MKEYIEEKLRRPYCLQLQRQCSMIMLMQSWPIKTYIFWLMIAQQKKSHYITFVDALFESENDFKIKKNKIKEILSKHVNSNWHYGMQIKHRGGNTIDNVLSPYKIERNPNNNQKVSCQSYILKGFR